MSWFGGLDAGAELDGKIERATSEAIPHGEIDVAEALEITDLLRSKKVPPKQGMRCLKKRLAKVYENPNRVLAVLKLLDICVKNGGLHFVAEITSKEFLDYLVDFVFKVHYDTKNYRVYSLEASYAVGLLILRLLKEWTVYLAASLQGLFLEKVYTTLVNQGYEFPDVDPAVLSVGATFVDSTAPPDWIDGKECMVCYTPFSVMNRKHHCRACGGVVCQTHSASEIPLPNLGLLLPVRVCDNCLAIHGKNGRSPAAPTGSKGSRPHRSRPLANQDDDDDLKRAIELSLADSGVPARQPTPPPQDDLDDDMRAAIAASLAEAEAAKRPPPRLPSPVYLAPQFQPPPQAPQAPELEFYLNMMSFDPNAYLASLYQQSQQQAYPAYPQHALEPQGNQGPYQSSGIQAQMSGHVTGSQTGPAQQTGAAYQQTGPTYQQTGPAYQQTGPAAYQSTGPASAHSTGFASATQNGAAAPDYELTQKEEDDIALFVQLLSNVRDDPSKRANILSDQNLSELHSRVVRLKPKVNRALRDAIEKYDLFLEMNNKLTTITRLYDQFLEDKLNEAYGKHTVSGKPYKQAAKPYESSQSPEDQSPYEAKFNAYDRSSTYGRPAPYSLYDKDGSKHDVAQYKPALEVAPNPFESYGEPAPHGTSPDAYSYDKYYAQSSGPDRPLHAPPDQAPAISPQASGVSDHARPHTRKLSLVRDHRSQSFGPIPYPVENSGPYSAPVVPPESTPAMQARFTGLYPQGPLSPPDDSEAESEAESDTESVASRFPPVMTQSEDPGEAEAEPALHAEHASIRFPTVENMDSVEPAKYVLEPEPLIEL